MPFRSCGHDKKSGKSDGKGFLRPKFRVFLYTDCSRYSGGAAMGPNYRAVRKIGRPGNQSLTVFKFANTDYSTRGLTQVGHTPFVNSF